MKKKKEKKKTIVIVLVVVILLLGLLVTIRKTNKNSNKIIVNKELLVCTKKAEDKYTIKVTTKYKKDKVDTITFNFINNSNIAYGSENYNENLTSSVILLKYYSSLVGSDYSVKENVGKVILNKETLDYYPNEEQIKKIFSSYSIARKYYEKQDYSCK